MSCPSLLVAATSSGQGKTTVAAALARLHTSQGRKVRVFKCGPDFLDPFWLALASGAPVDPLDLWMTGADDCQRRLAQAEADADLIIIEGVMGLFDGQPSAADLAQRFGVPVLAVVDASAMAGTFGAVAFGLRCYRPDLPWAGVLANGVAGASHAEMLRAAVSPDDWLGALPRDPKYALPERHLGLVAAYELADANARLDRLAESLQAAAPALGDIEKLARFGTSFGPMAVPFVEVGRPLQGVTIAVARDAAYSFVYEANLRTLEQLGATLSYCSPLADDGIPRCDALWLPGGYPEMYADRLSTAARFREGLLDHAEKGKPVWAECGGMMLLFDELQTLDGTRHRGWGLMPGAVRMEKSLQALGPQQLRLTQGTLRGHSFHYSSCDSTLVEYARTSSPLAGGRGEPVYRFQNVRASYFHAWFPSSPQAAASLFLR